VPKGCAHGFCVLSEEAVFQYKCDEFYHPEAEGAIAWDDPEIGIPWPAPAEDMILSDKDLHHPLLQEAGSPFSVE
ncbi:MAG: dTDP-4-dehydrorhamnose 3,5-epimerase, partial [Bacteroidales bacterium]|nr:dTDP-4-dehydrorhamnose 3,5-epimerase [Bacteroidales bacterium]